MDSIAVVIFLALVGMFAVRSWRTHGRFLARDRCALVSGFVAAIMAFALASLLVDWTAVSNTIWLVGVGLLAAGVAGSTLRWPSLAWFKGTKPVLRGVGLVASLVVSGLVIGVAFI